MSNLTNEKIEVNSDAEYTITETAKILRLSGRHVRRLVDSGEIRARKMTLAPKSPWRVAGDSILEYLDAVQKRTAVSG